MNFSDSAIRYLVIGSFVSVMAVALVDGIGNYSKNTCMQSALDRGLKAKDISSECRPTERKSIISLF